MSQAWVYALADSKKPSEIKYIGRTCGSMSHRLAAHVWYSLKGKTPKDDWMRSVISSGGQVIIWPMERCGLPESEAREEFWINFFKPLGIITNQKLHGKGVHKYTKKRVSSPAQLEVIKRASAARREKKLPLSDMARRERAAKFLLRRGLPIAGSRSVICIETGEVFASLTSAARSANVVSGFQIAASIERSGTCGGKHWRFT